MLCWPKYSVIGALATALSLAGCATQNWSPLFGTSADVSDPSSKCSCITVALIPEFLGQKLRIELEQNLRTIPCKYPEPLILKVDLQKQRLDMGIRPDGLASRIRLTFTASYTLSTDKKPIFKGTVTSLGGFFFDDNSFYSNTVAEESTALAALEELAVLLVLDIGARLEKISNTSAAAKH